MGDGRGHFIGLLTISEGFVYWYGLSLCGVGDRYCTLFILGRHFKRVRSRVQSRGLAVAGSANPWRQEVSDVSFSDGEWPYRFDGGSTRDL